MVVQSREQLELSPGGLRITNLTSGRSCKPFLFRMGGLDRDVSSESMVVFVFSLLTCDDMKQVWFYFPLSNIQVSPLIVELRVVARSKLHK